MTDGREAARTLLGFPAWPSVNPDPRGLSTDDDELDKRLVRWLDLHEGERFIRRAGDVCTLTDRGVDIVCQGAAVGESSAWRDAVAKALQVGISNDYFEKVHGRRPGPED